MRIPGYPDLDPDDLGTIRWFGDTWGADVCDPRTHIPTPVGVPCERCEKPIGEHSQGITLPPVILGVNGPEMLPEPIAYHLGCWLRGLGIDPYTGKWSPCCEKHTPGKPD